LSERSGAERSTPINGSSVLTHSKLELLYSDSDIADIFR